MKDLPQAISDELSKQKKQPEELVSLNLDARAKATSVQGIDAFVNLKSLSLCSLGLTTLEGFPKLPKLVRLTLSDNRISGGLQHLVDAGLTSLRVLELANNRIASVEELAPLKGLPSLQCLDVDACPLTKQPGHAAKVFAMLDELKYLDNVDKEGRERDGDEEEEDFEEEDAGEEEYEEGGGEGEEEDEEGAEFDEEKEYAVLVGPDAVGEDEDGDYEAEGEGDDDDDDEGEAEEEAGEGAPATGTKRKREDEEPEEGADEEGGDE